MTKEELKNRISMALKDPMLQQGFEIICKEIAELKKTIEDYKTTNHSIASDYANLSKRAIKWVKIAEGMPENCTCVLCALKDGGLETAYYEDGDFTFEAPAIHVQDVAAWAYIPEYKE